jgi:hypothetical protein
MVETLLTAMEHLVYLDKVTAVDGGAVVILATLAVEAAVLVQAVKTHLLMFQANMLHTVVMEVLE